MLDAAYTVGLSGPGRLHDLLVTLEAVTPGELKEGGHGLGITYGFSDDTLRRGAAREHGARAVPSGLRRVRRGARGRGGSCRSRGRSAQLRRDEPAAADLARRIWERRRAGAAPLRLAVQGTNFQLKVWQALLELGRAGPTTYSALAQAAGVPGGARAVGNAVGANPVAWLIPCHNVLRQDGSLGGYHWGEERKRAMLAWSALSPGTPSGRGMRARTAAAGFAGERRAT